MDRKGLRLIKIQKINDWFNNIFESSPEFRISFKVVSLMPLLWIEYGQKYDKKPVRTLVSLESMKIYERELK